MKHFTHFISLALLLFLSTGFLVAQSIPNPEILYYKFDGSGTKVPNLAQTPPTGTDTADIIGAMTQGGVGQCGGALIGNGGSGTSDYVNTYWTPNIVGTSWTISFWTSNIPSSTTLFYIFGDINSSSFRCFTNGVAGAGNWILRGNMTDILATGGASSGPSMTTFVYDATASTSYAYVNGVLVSTVAQNNPTIQGAGPFKVGAYGGNTTLPAGGLMDEFRLYNRALTSTEILALYERKTFENLTLSFCESYTSPSGNYTWTASGNYADTIPNSLCGDSIINIDLTIDTATSSIINITSCFSYESPSGNYTWTNSNTYLDTISNVAGCDSVITINLTINTIDNTVSQNGVTLSANQAGAGYQWIDCNNSNQAISGATNQFFTATANGDYAVIISLNGCTDTSSCTSITTVGILENSPNNNISIYPNPASNSLNITLNKDEQVEVYSITGKLIDRFTVNKNFILDIKDYPQGMYLIKTKYMTAKFIKE
jgi:hypothetical protein